MKYPKIVIEWKDWRKRNTYFTIQKLTNGYLIGNTFIASKEKLANEVITVFENPDAYFTPPEYND